MSIVEQRTVWSVIGLALALTSAGRASALSCALPQVRAPQPGSVGVPTNTRVWCSVAPDRGQLSQVVLQGPDGEDVAGTTSMITTMDFDLLVFEPEAALAPNGEYTANCVASFAYPAQPDAGFLARDAFSFTTGAEPRLTPPRVPDLSRVEVGAAEGYWGTNYQATFRGAIEGGSLIVLDLGGGAALDPDAPAGATSSFAATAPDDTDAWVGVGPCGGNWPGASLGASTSVALGAFDLTGAFSGWSDTVTVTLPDQAEPLPEEERPFSSTTPYRGAGHSSCNLRPAPSSAFGAAALLSLALVGVARARRKRRG